MNQPWIYVCSPSRSPLPPPSPPDSSGSSQCTRTCLMHPTWAGDLFPVYVFIHSFLFAMCPHLQGPYKMCPIVPSELVMWVPPSAMPFLWKCCDPLPPGSPVTGRICQQLAKEEYESSRLCEVLDVCEFFFHSCGTNISVAYRELDSTASLRMRGGSDLDPSHRTLGFFSLWNCLGSHPSYFEIHTMWDFLHS